MWIAQPVLERLEPRWLLTTGTVEGRDPSTVPVLAGAESIPFDFRHLPTSPLMVEATLDDRAADGKSFPPASGGVFVHTERFPLPMMEAENELPVSQGLDSSVELGASPETAFGRFIPLPNRAQVQVNGYLDLEQDERIYRIPVDPGTLLVAIKLRPMDPTATVNEGVAFFDGKGHALSSLVPPPGCRVLVVNLRPDAMDRSRLGGAIFLRLTMPPSSESGSATPTPTSGSGSEIALPPNAWSDGPPLEFELTVERTTMISPESPIESVRVGGSSGVGVSSVDSGTPISLISSIGLSPAPGMALITLTTRSTARPGQNAGTIGTGPLPTLATNALGGLLAPDGEDPTTIDRPEAAAIDAVLLDLETMPGLLPGDSDGTIPVADGTPSELPDDAVILSFRGPGGVPLFGATLLTESVSEPAFVPPALPLSAEASTQGLAHHETNEAAKPSGPARSRPGPVLASLTFALALSLRVARPGLTDPLRRVGNRLRGRF